MKLPILLTMPFLAACALAAQAPQSTPAFEVATIKPVESTPKSPRYIVMQGQHRFVEKDYSLKLLIAAAYNLNPKAVSGGPLWIESDHFDILALTPRNSAFARSANGHAAHAPRRQVQASLSP